jgi:hypothetical protein
MLRQELLSNKKDSQVVECSALANLCVFGENNAIESVKAILALLLVAPAFAQPAPTPKPIDLLKQKLEQISSGVSADWGIYIK